MNKKRAVEAYINSNFRVSHFIERLLLWDESKSLKGNAIRLNKTIQGARAIARRYHLLYKKEIDYNYKRPVTRGDAYIALRSCGWTFDKISKIFGVTKQAVEMGIRNRTDRPIGRPLKSL